MSILSLKKRKEIKQIYRNKIASYNRVPDIERLTALHLEACKQGNKQTLRFIHDRMCQNIIEYLVVVEETKIDEGIKVLFELEYAFFDLLNTIRKCGDIAGGGDYEKQRY